MADYAAARVHMVDSQLRTNKVRDGRVLDAFESLPREVFVPESRRGIAYVDEDLLLDKGRYLMEPMVLARLLQVAEIGSGDVALDVGCATGYSSALLAKLAATVVALESDATLVEQANRALSEQGVDNVVVVEGPLSEGYPAQAPYDVILISGAVAEVPRAIREQLAEGGRLVTVVRGDSGPGRAMLYQRSGGIVSGRPLFDASTPILPGFEPKRGFVF